MDQNYNFKIFVDFFLYEKKKNYQERFILETIITNKGNQILNYIRYYNNSRINMEGKDEPTIDYSQINNYKDKKILPSRCRNLCIVNFDFKNKKNYLVKNYIIYGIIME